MSVDKLRKLTPVLLVVATAFAVGACGGAEDTKDAAAGSSGGDGGKTLSLVAFSTPQVVYDEVIPEFEKTPEGEGVGFKTSYGGSGDQSRAVEAGLKADIVHLSLEPDVTRLVDAGLVSGNWQSEAKDGVIADSVVAFAVRAGNPKNIQDWDDLLKPGVEVVTPNPFSSGGAKWNLLAGYGAKGDLGKKPEAGLDYLRSLMTEHVKVQDKSAREALQTFLGGQGDVLLAYENEAITAQKKGEEIDYVVPSSSLLIETPIAVTNDAAPEAKAFLQYLLSEPAQTKFAEWGYRPVDKQVYEANKSRFKQPADGIFTMAELGGWEKLNTELFDPEDGSVAAIEEEAGVSTAS